MGWILSAAAIGIGGHLFRRTGYGGERAENTTVARLGTQQFAATGALVIPLAGIDGHLFVSADAAVWTGNA
jgi:hypothetical protein